MCWEIECSHPASICVYWCLKNHTVVIKNVCDIHPWSTLRFCSELHAPSLQCMATGWTGCRHSGTFIWDRSGVLWSWGRCTRPHSSIVPSQREGDALSCRYLWIKVRLRHLPSPLNTPAPCCILFLLLFDFSEQTRI